MGRGTKKKRRYKVFEAVGTVLRCHSDIWLAASEPLEERNALATPINAIVRISANVTGHFG
jgi:hypothetical protein